ncbi:hypothetical protein ACFW9F_24735 [Streptomyces sp. NPDC059506]|uniref:hypothetical protein n=1 Tax=Streptomyces sp. NPDC059506 TaxID=3347751 RepID=UPI0036B3F515
MTAYSSLLVVKDLAPASFGPVLARCFGVAPDSVDVADDDSPPDEERNWDALVFCDYARVRGDISWILNVYVRESVTDLPDEASLAAELASLTGSVLFYDARVPDPSAHWAVAPSGTVTRAWLYEDDGDPPSYTVYALEEAIPELPRARVGRIRG